MFNRGIVLGKVWGILIEIDFSWFWIFLLVSWSLGFGVFPELLPGFSTLLQVSIGILAALFLFVSVLAHEMAHSLVARKFGLPVEKITLFLFGGISNLSDEPSTPKVEFFLAAAGPALSLVLAASFWAISLFPQSQPLQALFSTLGLINFSLAIFNLLPGYPLDGGRILRSILWATSKNLDRSTYWAAIGGQFIAGLIIGLGALQMILSFALSGLWLILIGFYLFRNAKASYEAYLLISELRDKSVSDLASSNFLAVESSASIKDLWEELIEDGTGTFLLIEENQVRGVVRKASLSRVKESDLSMPIVSISTPLDDGAYLRPGDSVVASLAKYEKYETNTLPIVQKSQILGILRLEDIQIFLQSARKQRKD